MQTRKGYKKIEKMRITRSHTFNEKKKIIRPKLMEISHTVSNYLVNEIPISEEQAQFYIEEVLSFKNICKGNQAILQVIDNLVKCLEGIVEEQQKENRHTDSSHSPKTVCNDAMSIQQDEYLTECTQTLNIPTNIDISKVIHDSKEDDSNNKGNEENNKIEVDLHRALSILSIQDFPETQCSQSILDNFVENNNGNLKQCTNNVAINSAIDLEVLELSEMRKECNKSFDILEENSQESQDTTLLTNIPGPTTHIDSDKVTNTAPIIKSQSLEENNKQETIKKKRKRRYNFKNDKQTKVKEPIKESTDKTLETNVQKCQATTLITNILDTICNLDIDKLTSNTPITESQSSKSNTKKKVKRSYNFRKVKQTKITKPKYKKPIDNISEANTQKSQATALITNILDTISNLNIDTLTCTDPYADSQSSDESYKPVSMKKTGKRTYNFRNLKQSKVDDPKYNFKVSTDKMLEGNTQQSQTRTLLTNILASISGLDINKLNRNSSIKSQSLEQGTSKINEKRPYNFRKVKQTRIENPKYNFKAYKIKKSLDNQAKTVVKPRKRRGNFNKNKAHNSFKAKELESTIDSQFTKKWTNKFNKNTNQITKFQNVEAKSETIEETSKNKINKNITEMTSIFDSNTELETIDLVTDSDASQETKMDGQTTITHALKLHNEVKKDQSQINTSIITLITNNGPKIIDNHSTEKKLTKDNSENIGTSFAKGKRRRRINQDIKEANRNVENDLSWVRNIKYVREVTSDEYVKITTSDDFWTNHDFTPFDLKDDDFLL